MIKGNDCLKSNVSFRTFVMREFPYLANKAINVF